jgi:organic hydroperoxide reductase OsmC/OhrA
VAPLDQKDYLPDIITKLGAAEVKHGVEGGAGSSLKSEQKRTLHVHAEGILRADGLKEVEIRLIKPIGSTFKFVSDETSESAPPSLAYLSAGVGFCYMTQLGRYANIVKLGLNSYSIVQDNIFAQSGSARNEDLRASARPVDTHLFVKLDGSDQDAKKLLKMGEQTCFLHAAMRSSNRTQVRAEINGTQVEIEPGT